MCKNTQFHVPPDTSATSLQVHFYENALEKEHIMLVSALGSGWCSSDFQIQGETIQEEFELRFSAPW